MLKQTEAHDRGKQKGPAARFGVLRHKQAISGPFVAALLPDTAPEDNLDVDLSGRRSVQVRETAGRLSTGDRPERRNERMGLVKTLGPTVVANVGPTNRWSGG